MTQDATGSQSKVIFPTADKAIAEIGHLLSNPRNQRFLLCGHVRPDGDCVGSLMALHHYLAGLGREARLYFRGLNQENMLELLPGGKEPDEKFPTDYAADVTICVDVSDEKRVAPGFPENARGIVVVIDHHASNPGFGHLNWIDPKSPATGEMLFRFFEAQNGAFTPEIASCLYFALSMDTGGFRYSNTGAAAFRAAMRLVEEGAQPAPLATLAWGNQRPETIRIVAAVLGSLHFELDGRFVWSEITQEIYRATGGERNDPDNLSGDLRGIKGVEVALLLREGPEGSARASLRSSGAVDVNAIASRLGGGGHRAAAGLEIPGPYAESRERILQTIREGMAAQLK
jgi:bifunctional oligoribonuclease and PAP phosphatase NrnA